MTRIKPVRQAKGNGNGFYKVESGCGKLGITIVDGDDRYPIRVIIEPIGGGCAGGIEYLRRSISYILECNLDLPNYIDVVLDKIICPTGRARRTREKRDDVHLSCSKAVAWCLKKHLEEKSGKDDKKQEAKTSEKIS